MGRTARGPSDMPCTILSQSALSLFVLPDGPRLFRHIFTRYRNHMTGVFREDDIPPVGSENRLGQIYLPSLYSSPDSNSFPKETDSVGEIFHRIGVDLFEGMIYYSSSNPPTDGVKMSSAPRKNEQLFCKSNFTSIGFCIAIFSECQS